MLGLFKSKKQRAKKSALHSLAIDLPTLESGCVWLVGSGPGDAGLLTIHALNAIEQAEVIVYDALVDQSILSLAPKSTELIYAGKRGGRPSHSQRSITEHLIELAQQGKKVVRLKGGDPFVFGRGGEEAIAFKTQDIPFRIVPGITAGIGGLCYAGIPVTHRETNYSVTFVTGHASTGSIPDSLNWDAIAKGSQVIVFYMALKHIKTIQNNLIKGGRATSTPCAVIENATTPKMRVGTATLKDLIILASKFESPSIIVVGDVVNLRDDLDWLETLKDTISINGDS